MSAPVQVRVGLLPTRDSRIPTKSMELILLRNASPYTNFSFYTPLDATLIFMISGVSLKSRQKYFPGGIHLLASLVGQAFFLDGMDRQEEPV